MKRITSSDNSYVDITDEVACIFEACNMLEDMSDEALDKLYKESDQEALELLDKLKSCKAGLERNGW